MTPEELVTMDDAELQELGRMVNHELDQRQRAQQQQRLQEAALARAVEAVLDVEERYLQHVDPIALRAEVAKRPAPVLKPDKPEKPDKPDKPDKPEKPGKLPETPTVVDPPRPVGPPVPPARGE